MKLVYVDFWLVVKFVFLIWLCFGIVLVVVMVFIWVVLFFMGVFGKLDFVLVDILSDFNFSIVNLFGLG